MRRQPIETIAAQAVQITLIGGFCQDWTERLPVANVLAFVLLVWFRLAVFAGLAKVRIDRRIGIFGPIPPPIDDCPGFFKSFQELIAAFRRERNCNPIESVSK